MRDPRGLDVRIRAKVNLRSITWDGDKELDSVPVPVEGQLGLGHPAVGDEAPRRHSLLFVRVNTHL